MPKTIVASTLVLLFGWMVTAQAQEPGAAAEFKIEARIYRVMTNITGNGLTSRTLPGLEGLFHVVHEKLNDIELVMEGDTLTWDGKPEPDDPFIVLLSKPSMLTIEGIEASIKIGQAGPVQYFEKVGDMYALRSLEPKDNFIGVEFGATVRGIRNQEGVIQLDFKFRVSSVTSRERIEGVQLNVGRPIIRATGSEGLLTVRDGEWACYRTAVESQGHLYVFLLVEEVRREAAISPDDEVEAVRRAFLEYQQLFEKRDVEGIIGAHDTSSLSRQFDTSPEKIQQVLREEYEGYSNKLFELIATAEIAGVETAPDDIRTALIVDLEYDLYLVHASESLWMFVDTARGWKTLGHDFEGEIAREMSRLNIRFHPNK